MPGVGGFGVGLVLMLLAWSLQLYDAYVGPDAHAKRLIAEEQKTTIGGAQ